MSLLSVRVYHFSLRAESFASSLDLRSRDDTTFHTQLEVIHPVRKQTHVIFPLYGNDNLSSEDNTALFLEAEKYIKETKRFKMN